MERVIKIVLVAGETSGDLHAANLVKRLHRSRRLFEFSGIGGSYMQEAGVNVINNLAKHGVTGFSEVIRKFSVIKAAFKQIIEHIEATQPDLVILIDYPGFNLRLAKKLQSKKTPILYYISPQIWAWKAGRIKLIKQCIDKMAVILPFEKKLYQHSNVPVSFVGHPLVGTVKPSKNSVERLRKSITLSSNKTLIALLPGSRENEIRRLLPVMLKACVRLLEKNQNLAFVLPIAPSMDKRFINHFLKQTPLQHLSLIEGQSRECLQLSKVAIIASGTASLECALIGTPMVVVYKISALTYLLAAKLVKVKFISLVNLILEKLTIPELIQADCTAENLEFEMLKLLESDALYKKTTKELNQLAHSLSSSAIDCTLEDCVIKMSTPQLQQIEKTT